MMDLEDIETVREKLQFRGAQGTTGSQATFLELFEGDADKIVKLNEVSTPHISVAHQLTYPPDPLQEGWFPVRLRHLHPDLHQKGWLSCPILRLILADMVKVDLRVANAVCALGATAERICSDIRHLANLKEMEEPFEKSQIVRLSNNALKVTY
jgi:adenylosuccinate lyase